MSEEFIRSKKDGITFREIVFRHLNKLLDITTREFRGGYWQKKITSGIVEEIYTPDTRKQYIQAVESFGDLLLGEYDKTMNKDVEKIQEDLDNIKEEVFEPGSERYNKQIMIKLKIMRKLFRKIILLLKREDYLKGKEYTFDASELDD